MNPRRALPLLGFALCLAGCASQHHRREGRTGPAAAPATAASPAALEGSAAFFAGRLSASVTISRSAPPATLRLKFLNHSRQTLLFEVDNLGSGSASFAVHPQLLSLTPGETGEPEPVVFPHGAASGQIALSLTLKMAGKTETQPIVARQADDPALSEWPGLRE